MINWTNRYYRKLLQETEIFIMHILNNNAKTIAEKNRGVASAVPGIQD
jgi:hypothetical protein